MAHSSNAPSLIEDTMAWEMNGVVDAPGTDDSNSDMELHLPKVDSRLIEFHRCPAEFFENPTNGPSGLAELPQTFEIRIECCLGACRLRD